MSSLSVVFFRYYLFKFHCLLLILVQILIEADSECDFKYQILFTK